MKLKNLFLVFVAVAAMVSCKSQYEILLNSNDVNQKYAAASCRGGGIAVLYRC